MAARGAFTLVLLALAALTNAVTVSNVLSLDDQVRFKESFYNAMPFEDLETAYHAVRGLKLMKAEIPPTQDVCSFVKDHVDSSSVKSLYYGSSISKAFHKCKLTVKDAESTLSGALKEGSEMSTVFYIVGAQTNLGLKVNVGEVIKAVKASINSDDDSIMGAAHAMLIATMLPKGTDVAFIFDMVEDTVAQADEIDNKYLQFEGGLTPTANVIYATYSMAEFTNQVPTMTEEQVMKFANYLLTRKHVQSVKDMAPVLFALDKLGNNPFHVPVVVQLYGSPVVSDDKKMVKVRVTNVMDRALGKMTVTATSAENSEGLTVLSNKMFTAGPDDYQLNFMTSKPGPGVYAVSVSVKPHREDKRLLGTSDGEIKVKVVTKVTIEGAELSVVDKEQNIKSKTVKAQYPAAVDSILEADYHQKVVMKFSLKSESTGELLTPHQAFVRLTNQKTNQEIFFVAEPEPSKVFKFDLDVGATAKDSFGSLSGKYTMDLIVGDMVIQNPLEWNVGVLSLTFAEDPVKTKMEKETMYHSKPEIEHMFRVPEKRPPKAVSTAFTVLVFLPLVIMLVVWLKLGANMSNFQFSLGGIVFHLGLGAIFVLYYCFFVSLNMFSTLKILAAIGAVTFLGGNSLLSNIAARRGKRPAM